MPNVEDIYKKKETGRPKQGYYGGSGKRVPGVTTICKHIDPSADGLIYWAVNLVQSGQDWKEVRDKAAREGTAVHDAVTLVCEGSTPEQAALELGVSNYESVVAGLKAFLAWRDQSHIKFEPFEIPLVSDQYRFGGTADLLGRDQDGRLHLADIKTGSLRGAAVLQVAAYRHLIQEELREEIVGCHLLRFDREEGVFTHVGLTNQVMDEAWSGFLDCCTLYELNKRLKKML